MSEQIVRMEVSYDPRAQEILARLKDFWTGENAPGLSNSVLVRYALDLADIELRRVQALRPQDRMGARRMVLEAKRAREM